MVNTILLHLLAHAPDKWMCTSTTLPPVLMTRHFDYSSSTSKGDNQSEVSSAPVVSNMPTEQVRVSFAWL